LAHAEERILMTADKDFGELIFRLRRAAFGILLVRLPGLPSATRAESVAQVIAEHGREMAGAFTVLSPGMVRIRSSR
jgi:predicted nuclease of predicted toxin-antitoxin system